MTKSISFDKKFMRNVKHYVQIYLKQPSYIVFLIFLIIYGSWIYIREANLGSCRIIGKT